MADVLLHQQSFDYALSRAATETVDWYPSPAGRSSAPPSSSPTTSAPPTTAESQEADLGGGPPRYGALGRTAGLRTLWERSAAAALLRQLPTWHLFVSSLGSDTICEGIRIKGIGVVALRYGLYGSVLANSKGYAVESGGAGGRSIWDRVRPVLQLRFSARCVDGGSKGVGFRVTFQDVKSISAVDAMFSIGRRTTVTSASGDTSTSATSRKPSSVSKSHTNILSHFLRFDRQLLTNYTIVNVLDRPEGRCLDSPTGETRLLRRARLGVGLVLRTKPFGINIFWGFCVEVLKSLVFLIHIDVLRRTCASIYASNVFGTGVDAAMRLRINVISFHRTILDIGLAYPMVWRGLRCCWRTSVNLGGLSIGGSIEDCTLGDLMVRSGEVLEDSRILRSVRNSDLAVKGSEWCSKYPILRSIASFSLPQFLVSKGADPTLQSVRVHITGGVNVRHPNLSNYTNPFSASHLYYNAKKAVVSSPQGRASGFFDGIKKPSSMHGFFSITFS